MSVDWFDAEVTDKSKGSLTVEVKVNADHVRDFENAILERVLKIIDDHKYNICWSKTEKMWDDRMDEIKAAVMSLKGGEW